MAGHAGKAGRALPPAPPLDVLPVGAAAVELQGRVPGDVAVLAARVLEDLAHGLEGGQAGRGIRLWRRLIARGRSEHDGQGRERGGGPHASLSGSRRSLCPVAAKTAFATAGATGGTPGSPTPLGRSVLGTMCTSTTGISWRRSGR